VGNVLSCSVIARPLDRFRSDLRRRYPDSIGKASSRAIEDAGGADRASEVPVRLRSLPPEIGVLLLIVGTAGVLLPGPVGSPFLVAGGVALWPAGFRRVESWFQRVAPRMFEAGVNQIEQFLADLERRYPGSVRES
jgi:hypothetical protein